MPIATTLGSVVTYYRELPTIKSNNPLQYAILTKTIISSLLQCIWTLN